MTDSEVPRTTFLGIPVYGDYDEADPRTPQWPIERLQPILQAVIDDPGCGPFGWSQYTPYFDDGDPCAFSIHGFWVITATTDAINTAKSPSDINPAFATVANDDEPDDFEDVSDLYSRYHGIDPEFGHRPRVWDSDLLQYVDGLYEGSDELRFNRIDALREAIESGHFLDVLVAAFGEHTTVTFHKDRIDEDRVDTRRHSHD